MAETVRIPDRHDLIPSLYHVLEKKKQENVMLYKIKYNWYENGIDKGGWCWYIKNTRWFVQTLSG